MVFLETASATEAYRKRGQDRVEVVQLEDRVVIIVADGAGGVGAGDAAAETVIREVKSCYDRIPSADQWASVLGQIDQRIGEGESTAVVADVRRYGIAGASVGDSQAWIVDGENIVSLTAQQNRKPLLGTGLANPVGFVHPPLNGVLLIATDGFFNYVKRRQLTMLVAQSEFCTIPRKCIELVRLPSGDLWDDIGIVAARISRPIKRRQRYEIS